jgi:hypothetical protein
MGACVAALTNINPALILAALGPILHFGALGIVALTHTPTPGSPWAKAYQVVELFAGVVGRAKETGLLPPAPGHLDDFDKQGEDLLKQLKASQ